MAASAATSLRAIVESGRNDIEVVAINDLGPVETNAHLLRYDSVHGRFPGEVTVEGDIDQRRQRQDQGDRRCAIPRKLPWKDLGVDIALECTGIFTAKDKAVGASDRRRQARASSRRRPTAPT